jgi:hypothetical protein
MRYKQVNHDFIQMTDEEIAAEDDLIAAREANEKPQMAREKRNQLLKDSDWTQMPDYSGANKADWATYRQLLRDVPAQSGFPTTINWPAEP